MIERLASKKGLMILAGTVGVIFLGVLGYMFRAPYSDVAQTAEIASLKASVADLRAQVDSLSQTYQALAEHETEAERRAAVVFDKEEGTDLTAAVSRVAKAVVSIVVTKDVPQLEVVYENPFGDDPMFGGISIRIPRYKVKGTEEQKVGAGSGFLISAKGYIVTNKHVVSDTTAKYTVLLSDGAQKAATVVYRDTNQDIAILKIDGGGYDHVTLGESASLKLGQSVFAIGNALGEYNNSVSVGIISGLDRDLVASGASGSEELKGVIQTDAAINPGNSGGPLVTFDGKVVGVNVATAQGSDNISFAIPINALRSVIGRYL